MKKILFSTIYLFLPFVLLAQSKDCKYKTKEDEFEKTTRYSIENKSLSYNGLSSLGYSIYAYKKNDVFEQAFILFSVNGKGGCTTSDSYVSFMFEDNEVKKYNYTGKIHCGTTIIDISLNKEDFALFLSKKIIKIRVSFDRPKDYEVSEKTNVKFVENIKCLLSAF